MKILQIKMGSKLVFPPILVVNWVSSCLSFFLIASCNEKNHVIDIDATSPCQVFWGGGKVTSTCPTWTRLLYEIIPKFCWLSLIELLLMRIDMPNGVWLICLFSCNINIPILVPCFNKKKTVKRLHASNVQSFKNVLMIHISFTKELMLGRRNCVMAIIWTTCGRQRKG
jgi:hypothetical protein